jgi:hypothetical protein
MLAIRSLFKITRPLFKDDPAWKKGHGIRIGGILGLDKHDRIHIRSLSLVIPLYVI